VNGQVKEWFSAAELAGLPGLPRAVQVINRNAQKKGWQARERQGRGGGREYHISSLPTEARVALAAKAAGQATVESPTADAQAGKAEAAKLVIREKLTEQAAFVGRIEGARLAVGVTGTARQRMDAKLDILGRFQEFRTRLPYKGTVARTEFCRAYNARQIEVPSQVIQLYPDVSEGSIFRWEKALQNRGLAALAGGYGNRRGTGAIDQEPKFREFILSMLHDFPHCRPDQIYKGMAARFAVEGLEIPSIKAIGYWVKNWKRENQDVFLKMLSPDKFNSRARVAVGDADENILRLNQLWEMDSTPGDVMCQDGRASIVGVIDVYTRRAKLLVCKSSTAVMVAALIRRSILDWGVPETIRTDNGSDYTSHHVQRVMTGLGVEQAVCPPFQPWKKPFIERFFRTFSHDLLELMPQFVGHNVAERKAIEERKSFADRLMKRGETVPLDLTADALQEFCDRWCNDVYLHSAHEGLEGKTPFQMIAAWREPIRKLVGTQVRALDLLMAEAPGNNGIRTVTKGKISIDTWEYLAPELGGLCEKRVKVLNDPLDYGRICVYSLDGEFLCIAECMEILGISRATVAAQTKEVQKKRVAEHLEEIREGAKRTKTKAIAKEILDAARASASQFGMLPPATEEYTSTGLEAAASAQDALQAASAPPALEEKAPAPAIQGKIIELFKRQQRDEVIDEEAAKRERFLRWLRLSERNFQGLTAEEELWVRQYQSSPEFSGMKLTYEAFGRV